MMFDDRAHAGRVLAERLAAYRGREDIVVLALPRGGVPVACEVARRLEAPLDVFVVRKLGLPGNPELAIGAVASGGVRVLNEDTVGSVSEAELDAVVRVETAELERRERLYRAGRPPPRLEGRTAILIDDGLATGSTMRAAVRAARRRGARVVVAAVPLGSPEACRAVRADVDELLCVSAPFPFPSVGTWYHRFDQTSDEEVQRLLEDSARRIFLSSR